MDPKTFSSITSSISHIATVLGLLVGAWWAIVKRKLFRDMMHCIQFDVEAKLIRLKDSAKGENIYTRKTKIDEELIKECIFSHVVEVSLIYTNKGKTRFRLYNAMVHFNTMRPIAKTKIDTDIGYLKLQRIFSSGNMIRTDGQSSNKSSFYYIEPGVTQTIRYLFLIPEPRELLQVNALFSLEQERIFPHKLIGAKGLHPHTASKTYSLEELGVRA